MVAAGILGEDDRVELIEGELLVMTPQEPLHASTVHRLTERLFAVYGGRFGIRVQLPLVASDVSLPEPDLAVVRGDAHAFERRHPSGSEAVLVIEVSSSSERRDLRKVGVYAKAGVPVYWRVCVDSRRLELFEGPRTDGIYSSARVLDEGDEVALPEANVRWKVAELLAAP